MWLSDYCVHPTVPAPCWVAVFFYLNDFITDKVGFSCLLWFNQMQLPLLCKSVFTALTPANGDSSPADCAHRSTAQSLWSQRSQQEMTGLGDGADPRGKCRRLQNTAVEFTEVIEPSGSIVSGVIATLTRFQTTVWPCLVSGHLRCMAACTSYDWNVTEGTRPQHWAASCITRHSNSSLLLNQHAFCSISQHVCGCADWMLIILITLCTAYRTHRRTLSLKSVSDAGNLYHLIPAFISDLISSLSLIV